MIIKKLVMEEPYQSRDAPENKNLKCELHCEFENHIQALNFMDELTKMIIVYKDHNGVEEMDLDYINKLGRSK